MEERVDELDRFAAEARTEFTTFVLLGMGGSSLAPEVLKRTFGVKSLHVLDTTHPAMIRHSLEFLDLAKTMFVVSSKSGTTLSSFGIVPAALMEIGIAPVLEGAVRMADACRGEANPGLELGLRLGENWREGRDQVCLTDTAGNFGLWAEQLIAESTGK